MKIRTKIIWISCLAVLTASLTGDAVIWILVKNSYENEAFLRAYQNSYAVSEEIERMFEPGVISGENEKSAALYLQYYFKKKQDNYNVCIRRLEGAQDHTFEEIYNHTKIGAEKLFHLNYKTEDAEKDLEYAYLNWENGRYLVFGKQIGSDFYFYRIEDISHIEQKTQLLALFLLLLTLLLTALTSIGLLVVLRRVFKPLQELNETTQQMARGFYDQRLHIRQKDEIGQLGESFNKMAEAVEERTYVLKESERKKTLFMGDLTHELKTPMTAISGYAQTLLSTKLSEQQQEEALLYIYEECGRLERLSHKMMKLLELEQDQELELAETPVADVFEAVKNACSVLLTEKKLTLEIHQHRECFLMDADLMTDALINLVDNAIKASSEGGKIILKAETSGIEVQDFGCGIPADEQQNVLEPFYMVDKSRSRRHGGAGLGLALTAVIVRKHHMSLGIESEEGKGTKINLQFV